jgi:hypothetical protein
MKREIREPKRMRDSMSRPKGSVPRGKASCRPWPRWEEAWWSCENCSIGS